MAHAYATLIDLSQQRSDAAAAQMAQLMRRHEESSKKRAVLSSYRDEYRARMDEAKRRGAGGATIENFRAFVERLDEAVAQQQADADFWHQRLADARARWQGERRSLSAYSTLAERRAAAQALRDRRRERRAEDEFAARCRPAFSH
ncbi:MAG: flagellar export protein FliJ [Burkholderiales bacterium]|nr:flagellar export protein FliJ [Burkholderiales bacterium]